MEKIFILGENRESVQLDLGFPVIEMPIISNDEDVHDFVVNNLTIIEFEGLIIPIEIGEGSVGLKIGLHIRLTEVLGTKRLCPILFISSASLMTILKDAGVYGHILSTKGCRFLQSENQRDILPSISLLPVLTADDFRNSFLNIIHINLDEKIGRHSLANQWGAFILDKAAGTKTASINAELQKSQKKLYFKYIIAQGADYRGSSVPLFENKNTESEMPNTINSGSYKILLIDDEADLGWTDVLKNIFNTAASNNFQIISEKVKDFNYFSKENQEIIEKGDFDLFLVDLRLYGVEEEGTIIPSEFSGTKVLRQIKEFNLGNQVIIFTASNKGWNMKTLLDLGADGYYIKESPEYSFPLSFSKENYMNFKNEVEKCFKLNFLKGVFVIFEECKQAIDNKYANKSLDYQSFYDRCRANFVIAFEMLRKTSIDSKYFDLAYLIFYQIIEDYSQQVENFHFDLNRDGFVSTTLRVINRSTGKWKLSAIKGSQFTFFEKVDSNETRTPTTLACVSFILAFKFTKTDIFLQKWGKLNNLRNDAAHGGNSNSISISDIDEILEIVKLVLTND